MILLGWVETLLATTRGPSPWPSKPVSVTSPAPFHPISSELRTLHGTNLDVGHKPPSHLGCTTLTRFADGIELGLAGMGLVVLPIIVIAYKRINARKEAIMKEAGESGGPQHTAEELRRMGDKAPCFRYGI